MRIFVLSFLLCASLASIAQKKSFEVNTKGYSIGTIFRVIATPKINWIRGKHQVGVGPSLLLISKSGRFVTKEFQPVGLQQSYRFTPNESNSKVKLFFYEELTFQVINHKWETHEWDNDGQRYDQYEYINSEYLGLLNVGYGIELQLYQGLFIRQSVGLGIYYSASESEELTPGAPELFNEDVNINGYPNWGFTYGFNVGLEYKF